MYESCPRGMSHRRSACLGLVLAAALWAVAPPIFASTHGSAQSEPEGAGGQEKSQPPSATAQEDASARDEEEEQAQPAAPPDPSQDGDHDGRSGYAAGAPPLEGQDSVVGDLYQDDLDLGSMLRIPGLDGVLDPWWNAKHKLQESVGLKLQFSYQSLRQWVDESPDEDRATAGRLEVQGAWTVLGRKTKNPSVVTFRMEYRDTLGTEIPPSKLGAEFGSAGLVGTGFSDFTFAFRELAWRQTL